MKALINKKLKIGTRNGDNLLQISTGKVQDLIEICGLQHTYALTKESRTRAKTSCKIILVIKSNSENKLPNYLPFYVGLRIDKSINLHDLGMRSDNKS
ncbi:hypothetical protein Bhyg_10000 [Pseudolycoriella hygida]|uniref:Uncharacterized protein n=1 Tax=Pseudolycoriella hygida TaxID=35572 RepID=A0A9Q0MSM0_9DIPT|nr:hypothetical protein Bhyg_10000 [Pseudolycoriella hygida]